MNRTQALSEAFIHVSDKIGYTVGEIYQVYVQAQTAKATISIVAGMAAILFYFVLLGTSYMIGSRMEDEEGGALIVLCAFFFGILLAFAVYGAVESVGMRLLAPEYMAIQDMMSQLSSIR